MPFALLMPVSLCEDGADEVLADYIMLAVLRKNKFALLALTSFVMLIVLLSSQHRLRLIFGSYESTGTLHATENARYMVTPTTQAPPGYSEAITILKEFDDSHPLLPGDALPAIDQPYTC